MTTAEKSNITKVMRSIKSVRGFRISGIDAGLRKKPAPDIALLVADAPCTAAGVFTTNLVKAAPVQLDEERLKTNASNIRAVLVNAACANASTGDVGRRNAEQTAKWVAESVGCTPDQVLVMSTGVIGVQLPMDKLQTGIPKAVSALNAEGWHDASKAIMTTDSSPKRARASFSVGTKRSTIGGIAKGAGMIAPNMATMLSVIATDAAVPAPLLQKALKEAVEVSFNRIVVDGDMSTNDTVLLLASGASGVVVDESTLPAFTEKLTAVCTLLAQMVVRDGEGATSFITLRIIGARTVEEARQVGNTIATSPLVKTAFYGGDANWGRILAAAGRAGVDLSQDKLSLWFNNLQLVAYGLPLDYDEKQANTIAGSAEPVVTLDLGQGSAEAVIWTCDLSHDYVSINGHYRT